MRAVHVHAAAIMADSGVIHVVILQIMRITFIIGTLIPVHLLLFIVEDFIGITIDPIFISSFIGLLAIRAEISRHVGVIVVIIFFAAFFACHSHLLSSVDIIYY